MDEYKITSAKTLPTGWYWKDWDDGSGSLIAPDSTRHYSYDLLSYYAQSGIEYQETNDLFCPWNVFWGTLDEFKQYAENSIRKESR